MKTKKATPDSSATVANALAARAAKRKERASSPASSEASTAGPVAMHPQSPADWQAFARAKVAEHASRPPSEPRDPDPAPLGWAGFAEMLRDLDR